MQAKAYRISCLYSCLLSRQHLPRVEPILSHLFLLPHLQYRCATPSFPPMLCQEKEAKTTILPIFKNYDLHCFFLSASKMNRWKALGGKTSLLAREGENGSVCKPSLKGSWTRTFPIILHPAVCCLQKLAWIMAVSPQIPSEILHFLGSA